MKKSEQQTLTILAGLAVLWYFIKNRESATALLGTRTKEVMSDFNKKLRPIANIVEAEDGIKADLGIYQASLESKSGVSALASPSASLNVYQNGKVVRQGAANNLFGFKCGDAWLKAGKPYVLIDTTDYYQKGQKMPNGQIAEKDGQALKWPAPFRAYASWEESYRDWARLMQTSQYIADGALEALTKGDVRGLGVALAKHYAPNQNYEARLLDRARAMGANV